MTGRWSEGARQGAFVAAGHVVSTVYHCTTVIDSWVLTSL